MKKNIYNALFSVITFGALPTACSPLHFEEEINIIMKRKNPEKKIEALSHYKKSPSLSTSERTCIKDLITYCRTERKIHTTKKSLWNPWHNAHPLMKSLEQILLIATMVKYKPHEDDKLPNNDELPNGEERIARIFAEFYMPENQEHEKKAKFMTFSMLEEKECREIFRTMVNNSLDQDYRLALSIFRSIDSCFNQSQAVFFNFFNQLHVAFFNQFKTACMRIFAALILKRGLEWSCRLYYHALLLMKFQNEKTMLMNKYAFLTL